MRPYVRPLYGDHHGRSWNCSKLIDELRPAPHETVWENGADERPAVAYLGMPGSFSEEAVLAHLGDDCRPEPVESFERIVAGVAEARWPMGMVPLENSLTGCVNVNLDLLLRYDVSIVGEQVLPVPTSCWDSGRGYRGIAACCPIRRRWSMRTLPGRTRAGDGICGSTGWRPVRTRQAIPGVRLSRRAGQRSCTDWPCWPVIYKAAGNYTRFVLIDGSSRPILSHKPDLLCVIDHTPRSLYHARGVRGARAHLLSIASRPVAWGAMALQLYVDIAGNLAEPQVAVALEEPDALLVLRGAG